MNQQLLLLLTHLIDSDNNLASVGVLILTLLQLLVASPREVLVKWRVFLLLLLLLLPVGVKDQVAVGVSLRNYLEAAPRVLLVAPLLIHLCQLSFAQVAR